MMNLDEGRIFVGGIPRDMTVGPLLAYFSQYGHIMRIEIPLEFGSDRPRGFAYVTFSHPAALHRVLHQEQHFIGNRWVEVKRAWSRKEHGHTPGGGYKIFATGLPPTLDEEGVSQYFENFGHVTNVQLIYNQDNQRRGIGFVFFDTGAAVKSALRNKVHSINGKLVHVKGNLPKHANPENDGGGYQPYGASSVNAGGAYDSGALERDANPEDASGVNAGGAYDSGEHSSDADPGGASGVNAGGAYDSGELSSDADPGGASGVNAGGAFDSRVTYVQPQTTAVWCPYSGYPGPDYGYGNAYGGYVLDGYGNAGVGPYGYPIADNGASVYGVAAMPAPILYYPNQTYGYGNFGGGGFYPAGGHYVYPVGPWRYDPPPEVAQPGPNQQE